MMMIHCKYVCMPWHNAYTTYTQTHYLSFHLSVSLSSNSSTIVMIQLWLFSLFLLNRSRNFRPGSYRKIRRRAVQKNGWVKDEEWICETHESFILNFVFFVSWFVQRMQCHTKTDSTETHSIFAGYFHNTRRFAMALDTVCVCIEFCIVVAWIRRCLVADSRHTWWFGGYAFATKTR